MFWCFMISPDINQCVNSYFETGKSLIFKYINLSNILFIDFVKFEI